ncbi:MAG: chemotaxis protein CheA [Nitrospirae bacterium]|nr:chemotaxis protein CheA [Nitrospirota bacterium]
MTTAGISTNAFKEEAYELLTELESSLLELEERPDDTNLIGRVFRAMHTIKGSGAMFGFDNIAKFTHEVETVFDIVRSGKLTVTKELIDLTLASRDLIRSMLDASDNGQQIDETRGRRIAASLQKIAGNGSGCAEEISMPEDKNQHEASEEEDEETTYRIRFKPPKDIYLRGINPLMMLEEIRQLGEYRIVAQTCDIPYLDEFEPDNCSVFWDIVLTTKHSINMIKDVFIFVADDSEIKIDVLFRANNFDGSEDCKKLGEILTERGDLSPEDLQKVLGEHKRLGEKLVEAGLVRPDAIQSALAEQQHINDIREKRQAAESASSMRVPAAKLDTLVNLVGELVTVHARLNQAAVRIQDTAILSVAEDVERLMWELRDNTMSIRMLTIGTTFSRFKRLVRDLSIELGKDIELATEGAETELDKTVLDQLNDPLVHLIRNSIDHGIELPDVREAAGKPRKGTILLSAVHSGANILIQIKDDGAGINKEAVRAKAVEKGLIKPDSDLPENEIFSLILAPGFSTSQKVTSVSGRGVGMDVVKRGIDALRGTIDISSIKDEGTTITIRLPLTLAIIDGFLVRVSGEHYVIPLSIVSECMELTREHFVRSHGKDMVNVRGGIVPYIRLRKQFGISDTDKPDIEHLVITEVDGSKIGFVSDQIIGQHQTVIKNLGTVYKDVDGLSGATILGDGTVALILDIPRLVSQVLRDEASVMATEI